MIRVGRAIYDRRGNVSYPEYEGFERIVVMMRGHSRWSSLSPYSLKDDDDRIMENVWQFSKVYENVPKISIPYSRYDNKIIWKYKADTHIDPDGNLLPAYWRWREKGMKNQYAVRYPVGRTRRSHCKYAIPDDDHNDKLDYIQARIKIYMPEYCRLAKEDTESFPILKQKLRNGKNLLIVEPDGPHQESLEYYKKTYFVENDFIENNSVLINEESLSIMALDPKYPFGHGYCLAASLLGIDDEMIELLDEIIN